MRDHILSSRFNVQFTRNLSVRAVVDYNRVRANESFIDLKTQNILQTAAQLTYMVRPGTALYAGYSTALPNAGTPPGSTAPVSVPDGNQKAQVYLKLSYTFRP